MTISVLSVPNGHVYLCQGACPPPASAHCVSSHVDWALHNRRKYR